MFGVGVFTNPFYIVYLSRFNHSALHDVSFQTIAVLFYVLILCVCMCVCVVHSIESVHSLLLLLLQQ